MLTLVKIDLCNPTKECWKKFKYEFMLTLAPKMVLYSSISEFAKFFLTCEKTTVVATKIKKSGWSKLPPCPRGFVMTLWQQIDWFWNCLFHTING